MKERPILSALLFVAMGVMALVSANSLWFVPFMGAILLVGGLYRLIVALRAPRAEHKPVEPRGE